LRPGLGHLLVCPVLELRYQRVRVIAGFDGMVPAFDADLDRCRECAPDLLAEIGDGPPGRCRRQQEAESRCLRGELAPAVTRRDGRGERKEIGPGWLAAGRRRRVAAARDDGLPLPDCFQQRVFRLVRRRDQLAKEPVSASRS
jgi:hypothetical protein